MSKSARLRAEDWRAIVQLAGECRELGDDRTSWRMHLAGRLARLVDADLGFCGEMAGFLDGRPMDLGVAAWGLENGFRASDQVEVQAMIRREPGLYEAPFRYFERLAREDGSCHSRADIIADGDWYRSTSYQVIHRLVGVDHILWCFRSLAGRGGDEFSGLMLHRAIGRRDFAARARSIVREAHTALTPLIGGPLARYSEPSPGQLAPRLRAVLACLLEGDGDKQIAARLDLSPHTVNEYTKAIFRHFGARSRPELLARWVRRGLEHPPAWLDA